MKKIQLNNIEFDSNLSLYDIRKKLFDYYDKILTDKIRVFSLLYKDSKIICDKLGIKFDGYFGAIGELNANNFPINLKEKGGFIQDSRKYIEILKNKEIIIKKLEKNNISSFQYDLTGAGYEHLRKLLSKQEFSRTGIKYNYKNENNEIFVVNGASFGLKIVFEMLYRKYQRKVKTIFPLPMFTPILDASDIFLDSILFDTKEENNFKITSLDIENILRKENKIDAFYLCLVNNPTSISYTKKEVENIFKVLFNHNKNIQIILDGVYISGADNKNIKEIFSFFKEKGYLQNIILVDGEGKAKARTGKRSGSIYLKNRENILLISNILRNSTGGISSDLMIDTISELEILEDDLSQEIYKYIAKKRKYFLFKIFNDRKISKFLKKLDNQRGLPYGFYWQGGLYAFLKLKEEIKPIDFILKTGIIATPGEVFGSKKYKNYIRLSFGYQ